MTSDVETIESASAPLAHTIPTLSSSSGVASHPLPNEPLVVIEPKSWPSFAWREIWSQRELLYFLVWRDLKVRYKQTLLGITWVVFQPLLMTLIFTVIFGKLVRVPSDGIPYP